MISVSYAQVHDHLLVGSYPQSPEDVLHLKALGVTAVLSLQSDQDLEARAIQWDLFLRFYQRQGLEVVRVPIVDFDPDDLAQRLTEAVDALDGLIRAGHTVYLHCTAGLNRSPTTAIAWLSLQPGMDIDAATEHVQVRRRVLPYPEVLEAWARRPR